MNSCGKQYGRTRVNKVADSKIYNKRVTKKKQSKLTSFDKLCLLQKELFTEGYTLGEYKKHTQEKINAESFHYKNVTQKDIDRLYEMYSYKVKKENDNYSLIEDKCKSNKRRKQLFREKKKSLVDEKKSELINKVVKLLIRANVTPSKNIDNLSFDSEHWNETKRLLFPGISYLLDTDKEWSKVYDLLESRVSCYLFGFTDYKSFNKFIFES